MKKKNKKYDWKITLKKVAFVLAEVVLAGAIVVATENPLWLGLVPFFEGLRNYIKHK